MSHEVEQMVAVVNGEQGRGIPWHGLGNQAAQVMTDREALELGGLDWKVGLHPVHVLSPITKEPVLVPRTYASVRESDGQVFGAVGQFYTPIQNEEMIEFGSALVDAAAGHAHWDTAGSLRGGAVTFSAFKLSDVGGVKVGGVETERLTTYLLVMTSHDGSKSFRAAIVRIRVVCMNTLQWAVRNKQASWSIRHTKNWGGKLSEARRALDLTVDYLEEFDRIAERLMEIEVDQEEIASYVEAWVPMPEKKAVARAEEHRESLMGNILGSPTVPGELRRTRYGVLQGATEWAEHERPVRVVKSPKQLDMSAGEARFNSVLMDGGPVRDFQNRVFKDLTRDLGPDVEDKGGLLVPRKKNLLTVGV